MARERIGEMLVKAGLISAQDLAGALEDQKRWGTRLGVTLIRRGVIDEEDFVRFLAGNLGVPVADLAGKRIAPEVVDLLTLELAEKYHCVPLFTTQEAGKTVLHLGMDSPHDLAAVDDLTFRIGLKIRPVLVPPTQLADAIDRYYRRRDANPADLGFEGALEAPELDDTAPVVLSPEALGEARVASAAARLGLQTAARAAQETAVPAAPKPPVREIDPREIGRDLRGDRNEVGTRTILRAVTQLLIDKGLFTRAELMEAVQAAQAREGTAKE
jgi:type IV pilus assembly protein PilB